MIAKRQVEESVDKIFWEVLGVPFKPARCFGNCVYTKIELMHLFNRLFDLGKNRVEVIA